MIGNFIGDFVKGKAYEAFDEQIQQGILLHREIDRFTDNHQVVVKTKTRLRPRYHHYAPVIADVFYDHFLAALWDQYHPDSLLLFTENFYKLTDKYLDTLPLGAAKMLMYMKRDNWLYNYQFISGIDRALKGMSARTPYNSKMENATTDLRADYSAYQQEFMEFFPDLINHSEKFLSS